MKRSKTLQAILSRDNHLCGIHYGGCGREIKSTESTNIDHIIPKTLLKSKQGDSAFFKPNFLQPMHTKCNSIDKRGQLTTYPEFTCDCHYTYFNVETEIVEIYVKHYFKYNDTFEWKKEIFLKNFINHNEKGMGQIMHIGNRGTVYGFARGNDMGSMFHQYKYSDRYICYLMNIYALLKCKRFNEAKQEYTKYIEFIDTTDSYFRPDTLDKVTIYFESLSDKDDTSELASEILYILNPKTYHLRAGLKKCDSGDILGGIDHMHKSIKLGTDKDPDIAQTYSTLGYAYACVNKYKDAEKYLRKAIKLKPSLEYAKRNLSHFYQTQGLILLEEKRYEKALKLFIQAKDLLPTWDINYNLIAHTYLCIDDTDTKTAFKYLEDGLKNSPDSASLKENFQILEDHEAL